MPAALLSGAALGGLLALAGVACARAATGDAPRLVPLQILLGLACAPWLSGALFLAAAAAGVPPRTATSVGVALALAAGLAAVLRARPRRSGAAAPRAASAPDGFERALVAALCAGVAGLLLWTACASLVRPGGGWDAWAVWNLKARMLARGVSTWKDVFGPGVVHASYPLLLPAAIAGTWSFTGSESPAVPAAIAIGNALLLPLLTFAAVAVLKGRALAAVAGALTLAYPVLWQEAPTQTADVPLAACLVAGVACLCVAGADASAPRGRWLAFGGVLLGLTSWIKAEGLLYGLAFVAAFALAAARGPRGDGSRAAVPAVGFLLVAGARLLFDATVAHVTSEYLGQPRDVILHDLLAWPRHAAILAGAGRVLAGRAVLVPVLLGAAILGASGLAASLEERRLARTLVLALAASAAGLYGAYLVTPFGLEWQVQESLGRLLLHGYPVAVLALALGLRRP